MKEFQPKLTFGQQGNLVLVDATNLEKTKSKSEASTSKKRKSTFDENAKPTKVRKDGIYMDKQKEYADASVQTERTSLDIQERIQKIDNVPFDGKQSTEYYESLAEKRREALAETLKENEILKTENDLLKVENHITINEKRALIEENRILKGDNDLMKEEIQNMDEMLEESKELASLVKEITGQHDEFSY